MKKVSVLFLSLLVILTLTGCSMFGETIQENDVEFCLENPDDESCLIKEDVELDFVFLELYNDYLSNPSAFCDLYIDSDSDIADKCSNSFNELLPDNLLDYTITSDNQLVSENVSSYQLVFENLSDNNKVSVTIEFSYDNEVTTITDLSVDSSVIEELFGDLLDDEIEEIVSKDLNMFLEDPLYCSIIFPDEDYTDCYMHWQQTYNNNAVFDILTHLIREDGSHYLLVGESSGNYSSTYAYTKLNVYANYVDGKLVVTYEKDFDEYFNYINERKINDFIDFIELADTTMDDVSETFKIEDDSDILEIFNAIKDSHTNGVQFLEDSENTYTLTSHSTYEDLVLTLEYVYDFPENIQSIEIVSRESISITDVDFKDVVADFVKEFNKGEKIIEEINTFFINGINEEIAENYGQLEGYISDFELYEDNNKQIVYIQMSEVGYSCFIEFQLDNDGSYKINLDIDSVDKYRIGDDMEEDFEQFFQVLPSDIEGTCNLYFDDETATYCIDLFTEMQVSGMPVYHSIGYKNEKNYYNLYFYYWNEHLRRFNFQFSFTISQGMDEELKYSFVNSYYEELEIKNVLTDFESALADTSVTKESLYNTFIEEDNASFDAFLDYVQENDYQVIISEENIEYNNSYLLIELKDTNNLIVQTVLVDVEFLLERNENLASHKIIINSIEYISRDVSYDEIVTYLSTIVTQMNEVSGDKEFCAKFGDYLLDCENALNLPVSEYGDSWKLEKVLQNETNLAYQVEISKLEDDRRGIYIRTELFFYKVDGIVQEKLVLIVEDRAYVEPEVFSTVDSREEFMIFLHDILDTTLSSEDIILKYPDLEYDEEVFIEYRYLFSEFVSVTHKEILEENDTYTKDMYLFTDNNGIETELMFTLFELETYDGISFSIVLEDQTVEVIEFTAEELVDHLNGDSMLDIDVQITVVGTQNYLFDYLRDNNYRIELLSSKDQDIDVNVLDENEEVLYTVSYRYYIENTALNQYVVTARVISGSSGYYNDLDSYITEYSNEIGSGEISYDDLNIDTNCFSVFPESYTDITYVYMNLDSFKYSGYIDTYSLKVYYLVDGKIYQTFHTLSSVTENGITDYVWEFVGYNGPVPEGPSASIEIATDFINSFYEEYYDMDFSDEYISNTYFSSMTRLLMVYTGETRINVIDITKSIEISDIEAVLEDGVISHFTYTYRVTYGNSSLGNLDSLTEYEHNFIFNVIDLGNEQYYLDLQY